MPNRASAAIFALATALTAAGSAGPARAQQLPDLVTPDVLRVCADPANLPFSNRNEEGFENRIAALIADELKIPVRYYWLSQGPGFVRNTLGLKLCDVIVGYAAGAEAVQHTNPYYRSVYAMLVRRGSDLDGVTRLNDDRLKGRRIGVVAATPPIDHLRDLGLLDQIKPYSLLVDRRYQSPAEEMAADLTAGRIDAAILWGPTAGHVAQRNGADFALTPLVRESVRPSLSYRITLGIRPNEPEWKHTLNRVLRRRQADINKVLLAFGVPLLDEDDQLITAAETTQQRAR